MNDYIHRPPKNLPPGSIVIAYLRDSGGPKQEESIGQQERAIIAFCKEHKLILQKIYADTASGRKTKNRGQFLEMFNNIITTPQGLRPHGLLLWSFSRFSRDVHDFNYFFYGLLREGLIIHSLSDDEIPEGIAGGVVLSVKAFSNADYSEQLGKAIKRGIADRVKSGYNNGGTPPRGYKLVKEYQESTRTNGVKRIGVRWVVDQELAPLVRLAWELRAQGKSYGEITKATGGKIYAVKNSWTSHFENKSYLGIGKAGNLEIPDHHEPIITWEMWEAVKKVERATRVQGDMLHPRRISHPSLLSGLAYCVHCGAAMVLHTARDYRSYQCGTRDRRFGYKACPKARSVNARVVDKLILDTVLNQVLSPTCIELLLDEVQEQLVDTEKLDREIGIANNLLVTTERSIARLVRLAEDAGEIDEISSRLKQLKQEQAEHAAKLRSLRTERAVETPQITPEALELVFSAWRDQIYHANQNGEILNAKRLLAQFVSKVELARDRAVIHYTFPLVIPSVNGQLVSAHNSLAGR